MEFFKKHNITILCLTLIICLSSLATYNYFHQKEILLQQLNVDTDNIVKSVSSSISKFTAIKDLMNIQDLIKNISLKLDIFEFRYMDKDGTILNSMFKEEIGQKFERPNFDITDKKSLGKFYEDERDMTKVLAVSYPVNRGEEIVGIIDLAVDISEFNSASREVRETALRRMETDVTNLVNSVASSVLTSLSIFETVDFLDFLANFVKSTENIVEVALLDKDGKVLVSSNPDRAGKDLGKKLAEPQRGFLTEKGRDAYRIIDLVNPSKSDGIHLMLLMDATSYVSNVRQLLVTAIATSLFTILFALTIAYSIYRINLERAKKENARLESKVRERTKEIGDILDNVGQGILTVSEDLIVNPEYSLISEKIFEKKPAGEPLAGLLYQTGEGVKSFIDWAKLFFDPNKLISVDGIIEIAEKEMKIKAGNKIKTLHVEYRPIYGEDAKTVKKIMAVLTDITSQKEMEAKSAREREEHEQVVKILRDQDSFFSFLEESRKIISEAEAILGELLEKQENHDPLVNQLFRGMHTIKGTAAVFSIRHVSSLAHEIENHFNEIRQRKREVSPELVKELREQLQRLFDGLEGVVATLAQLVGGAFGAGHKVVKIKEEKIHAFQQMLETMDGLREARPLILRSFKELMKVPIGRAFRKFPDMAKTTAEKLGKEVQLEIRGGDLEIEKELEGVLAAPMMHIIRNSVDHGIEDPSDRAMLEKPEKGSVIVECGRENGHIVVRVKDDGKGIDPDEIKKVAVRKGFISEAEVASLSDHEAICLIFHPGFSSKEEATDLSGRGVGMDVVKTEVEKIGGSVELASEVLKGSTITLRLPEHIRT
ncbi:MAG: Hpt domain-containing protein [Nitrospinae bacterium]|nr:Hpt domain-containing protein [Nitrospinota bacterium]